MIRTIILSAALLAAAGVAQAGEVKVSLVGKTENAVKAELFEAAKTACKDVSVAEFSACVTESYTNAVGAIAKAKATKLAALTF